MLELENVPVDSAYRVGQFRLDNKPRNVKIKFVCESHRNKVFAKRHITRDKRINIFINEDLPPTTQKRRALLRTECNKAYKLGKKTRLLGDRLIIDGLAYEINDEEKLVLSAYQQDRSPRFNPNTLPSSSASANLKNTANGHASNLFRQSTS